MSRLGDDPVSPSEQAERIQQACARDGLTLVTTLDETNVSGGAFLVRRHGLRQAVELIEAKQADVVVVGYFDRLVRALAVQREVVERIERPAARSSPSTSARSATQLRAGSPRRCSGWSRNTIAA